MSSPTPVLDPRHTALLVMDFQRGVVDRMPGLDPLLTRVQEAVADVRDHGGTIGYVRVAFTEADWAAMSTTDLDRQLRDRGIDTLVLAGISTSGVVLSTVIEAADRDYRLYVLSDGTEDRDAETRDILLGKVFPRRAQVIDTAGLRARLQGT